MAARRPAVKSINFGSFLSGAKNLFKRKKAEKDQLKGS